MISNFVGKTRRQSTLLSQTASKTDPTTAQTTPSRRGSADVPAAQGSPYTNPQLASSQSSVSSTRDKKRPLLQRALSKTSLKSQDGVVEPPRSRVSSPFRRGTLLPRKTSGDDASKTSAAAMIEEHQENARRLGEELTTAQKQLADVTGLCSGLQERVQTLENENQEREAQIKSTEEAANEERTKLVLTHGTELETKRQELHELRESVERLKRESTERVDKMEMLSRQVEHLEGQVRDRDGQIQQLRVMEDSLNDALRKSENTVYERGRAIQDLENKSVQLVETNERLQQLVTELRAKLKEQPDESGFIAVLWKWFNGGR